jgi:hypothetical protein
LAREAGRLGVKHFVTDCTHAEGEDITVMKAMAHAIKRSTFMGHVPYAEMREIEKNLGYWVHGCGHRHLTMRKDPHVGYYRSRYRGRDCVYFTWSAIEHIFV